MSHLLKILTALVIISMITSCGFTLRGHSALPSTVKTIYVDSAINHAPLARTLKEKLKNYPIQLVQSKVTSQDDPADLAIHLISDNLDRRLLSLFPTGQVAEYELVYTIKYSLQFADKESEYIEFDVTREYQDDPNAVLAKSRELDLVLKEMRQLAADRIIRQIANSYNNLALVIE